MKQQDQGKEKRKKNRERGTQVVRNHVIRYEWY